VVDFIEANFKKFEFLDKLSVPLVIPCKKVTLSMLQDYDRKVKI